LPIRIPVRIDDLVGAELLAVEAAAVEDGVAGRVEQFAIDHLRTADRSPVDVAVGSLFGWGLHRATGEPHAPEPRVCRFATRAPAGAGEVGVGRQATGVTVPQLVAALTREERQTCPPVVELPDP